MQPLVWQLCSVCHWFSRCLPLSISGATDIGHLRRTWEQYRLLQWMVECTRWYQIYLVQYRRWHILVQTICNESQYSRFVYQLEAETLWDDMFNGASTSRNMQTVLSFSRSRCRLSLPKINSNCICSAFRKSSLLAHWYWITLKVSLVSNHIIKGIRVFVYQS